VMLRSYEGNHCQLCTFRMIIIIIIIIGLASHWYHRKLKGLFNRDEEPADTKKQLTTSLIILTVSMQQYIVRQCNIDDNKFNNNSINKSVSHCVTYVWMVC